MKSFIKSFLNAFRGILCSLQGQRNIKIQLAAAVCAAVFSLYLQISRLDWVLILLICFIVIILEIVNTAVEKTVDQISKNRRPKLGEIKDIMAGAVLIASIMAVIAGMIIWLPYIQVKLHN